MTKEKIETTPLDILQDPEFRFPPAETFELLDYDSLHILRGLAEAAIRILDESGKEGFVFDMKEYLAEGASPVYSRGHCGTPSCFAGHLVTILDGSSPSTLRRHSRSIAFYVELISNLSRHLENSRWNASWDLLIALTDANLSSDPEECALRAVALLRMFSVGAEADTCDMVFAGETYGVTQLFRHINTSRKGLPEPRPELVRWRDAFIDALEGKPEPQTA